MMFETPILRNWTTRGGRSLAFTPIGFGAAPLGNMRRALHDAEARAVVREAWDCGQRYFDTAPLYGHGLSETRVGAALNGEVRGSYLLSTKVGRLLEPCAPGQEDSNIYVDTPHVRVRYDYSYDGVMRSYTASLDRLGLDRIDILFVHDIDPLTHGSQAASDAHFADLIDGGGWRALDELRRAGDVAAIGAGLNVTETCERLMAEADPDIFLLAGRYTLLEQAPLDSLLPACQARGIGVVIGGPFNSGVLATGPIRGASYNYEPASAAILERVAALQAVCERHGVALPHAALHFPLGHPAVLSVIAGAQTPLEVLRNAAAFAEPIDPALWRDLADTGLIRADAPTPELYTPC
jgi:D-threo-aldose 1-dehydrogenase